MNHILHILIEANLLGWLKTLELEEKTVTRKIVYLMRAYLRGNGRIGAPFHNQMTRKPPPLILKLDFNLSMPLSLYRLVKKEQSTYNFFSKGLVVRNILWYYYYLLQKFPPDLAWEYFTGKHNKKVARLALQNARFTHHPRAKHVHMHKRYIVWRATIRLLVRLLE